MITDPDVIARIRALLASAVWNTDIKPALAERARGLIKTLVLSEAERPQPSQPEDMIRGRIQEIEYILSAFENEIRVFDHNRLRDELDRRQAQMENGQDPAVTANP